MMQDLCRTVMVYDLALAKPALELLRLIFKLRFDRRTFFEYTVYEAVLWYTPGQLQPGSDHQGNGFFFVPVKKKCPVSLSFFGCAVRQPGGRYFLSNVPVSALFRLCSGIALPVVQNHHCRAGTCAAARETLPQAHMPANMRRHKAIFLMRSRMAASRAAEKRALPPLTAVTMLCYTAKQPACQAGEFETFLT